MLVARGWRGKGQQVTNRVLQQVWERRDITLQSNSSSATRQNALSSAAYSSRSPRLPCNGQLGAPHWVLGPWTPHHSYASRFPSSRARSEGEPPSCGLSVALVFPRAPWLWQSHLGPSQSVPRNSRRRGSLRRCDPLTRHPLCKFRTPHLAVCVCGPSSSGNVSCPWWATSQRFSPW
jgi:hypothetical protein